MASLYHDGLTGSFFPGRYPSVEQFANAVLIPRKGKQELDLQPPRPEIEESRQVWPDSQSHILVSPVRGVKRQTSSVWSPHLQHDRRPSRYSLWEPPPLVWSAERGVTGRRNVQVILFFLGFVFPFGKLQMMPLWLRLEHSTNLNIPAWMIAAFIPLPPKFQPSMADGLHSTSHLDFHDEVPRQVHRAEEYSYQSARWWRCLNRAMAVVGIVIITVAVALLIAGTRGKLRT